MIRSSFAAIALLAFTAPNVDAVDRQAVTTVKPLLVTAIEQGEAHGVLVGQAAQYIAQTFKSTAFTYQFNYCRDGRMPQTKEASR